MLLFEIFDSNMSYFNSTLSGIVAKGYQSLGDDNSRTSFGGLRKSRLTLGQIKKLRLWVDARNIERKMKLAQLRKQYEYIPKREL